MQLLHIRWALALCVILWATSSSGCAALYTRQANAAYPSMGEAVRLEGRTTYLYTEGTGSTVVYVHGNPGDAGDAQFLQHALAPKGFRIIAFDRPGHGGASPASPAPIDVQLAQLDAIIRGQSESPVILVGHSWGGALCMLYARDHPDLVSALVLLAPEAVSDETLQDPLAALYSAWLPVRIVVENFGVLFAEGVAERDIKRAWGSRPVPSDRMGWLRRAACLWARPDQIRATNADERSMYAALAEFWSRECANSFLSLGSSARDNFTPTVIVASACDPLVDSQRHSRALVRHARESVFAMTGMDGHMVPVSDPDAVAEAVVCAGRWARTGSRPLASDFSLLHVNQSPAPEDRR